MSADETSLSRLLRDENGSILTETVIAMMLMTVAGVSLMGLTQRAMVVTLKARGQVSCGRMIQTGFSRVRNMDFYHVFDADSASEDYGLKPDYPFRAVLDGYRTSLAGARYDRFRITVEFMRRDTADADSDGLTSDLIAFTDADGDLIDDFDSAVRYFDENGDGDYYDTYVSGGRKVAEQPDTHIKRVRIELYRGAILACSQTENLSLEQFTGDPNPSSESVLRLLLSTPSNNTVLYSRETIAQRDAWDLAITKPYPAEVVPLRADIDQSLLLEGTTDPLASVRFQVNGGGDLVSSPADFEGAFSDEPWEVTDALVEGLNTLQAQAVKDSYTSPAARRTVLLDTEPPSASGAAPSGSVATRTPYVAVGLEDPGSSTDTTSGVCPDVLYLGVNGEEVIYRFEDGTVVWIDSSTQTSPELADGAYSVVLEAGDYAGYKVRAEWSFDVSVPVTDNSAPSIAHPSPSGFAESRQPEISAKVFDNQSGIIPSSIEMRVDGEVVVSSSNVHEHYDPSDDTVSFIPLSAFEAGTIHEVEVVASHWATDPPEKVTDAKQWDFTVP